MHLLVAALAASISAVQAMPTLGVLADDPRFTQWTPPGPDDVRSPCPGLNTLANHGFINHSGKNLSIPGLIAGLSAGMNVGADFTIAIGLVGLGSSPNPLGATFDLNDLDQHNFPIEHDASLSRQDAYFGNDYSFYQPNFDQLLSYFAGSETTNISSASHGKYARVSDSMKRNPTVTYGLREFILSYGETGLYLQTMSDPFSGVARVDYIKYLFEQEKLPYELGWRPSKLPVTLLSLGGMITELNAANPNAPGEDFGVAADSYKNLIEILAGGSEIVQNVTQSLGL